MPNHADVRILPPFVLAAAILAGALATFLVPLPVPFGDIARTAGAVFVAASVALVAAAARRLSRANTAFDVRKPTTALVRDGVFAISRNPVYLSMLLLQWGLALATLSPWFALSAILSGNLLCRLAIRPEERYLEALFGDEWRRYSADVGRWA